MDSFNKKKILFVSHSPGLYGAERSLLDLVSAMDAKYEAMVVVPALGDLSRVLNDRGIAYVVQPHKAWVGDETYLLRVPYRILFNMFSFLSLLKKIRTNGFCPDIVYTNSLVKPLGAAIAKYYDVPHVWHAREFVKEDFGFGFDLGEKLTRTLLLKTTSIMICNSYALKNKMLNFVPEEKIKVIYNGVLGERENISTEISRSLRHQEDMKLCIVGSLQPGKGQEDAIRCTSILKNKGYKVSLQVVGSGKSAYVDYLTKLVDKLKLEDDVIFRGFVSEPQKIMGSSHICLVCSRCEAFGRVAVEAMSFGISVVDASTGGLPEIIENRVNGLLYKFGDAEELSEKVEMLIEDKQLYENISLKSTSSVYERFTRDRYVEEIERSMRELFR